ncbi:hypothetical protein M8R55_13520 [Enterobacter hormaechei]|uniref:hypothetical protein n=1 Tax=Enterobacter hormaechei TaxID=158836 RepID=UPI0013CF9300|nr:hypothetical protein [Enterobacter hormaechei]HCM9635933.1 hypothetical protein [Enterobacter hormaechei subsp. steigerwaltii]MBG0594592.1 hypothetical protein [Enterobacter hormaechei]MCM7322912.1 hypothetical protein [Enterobacter hormaechei]MCM7371803.1 hypothetical protein [Enterobacter hormaechei]MDK7607741.1 hypothetical protein [Enterobacter hormaechei]
MYLIGFLFYIIIAISYFHIDEIYEIVNQSYLLAQSITIGMGVLYIYPLAIFVFICALSKKTDKHKHIIDSQTKIAASVSVSLGLIGTFQGLTAMVSSIASSMGGEGDIAEKMNSMLAAISSALSAMSYAFLTSILGVAVSVLLLLSLNFWLFYFKESSPKKIKNRSLTINYGKVIVDNFDEVEEKLSLINKKLDSQRLIEQQTLLVNQQVLASLSGISDSLKSINQQLEETSEHEREQISGIKANFEQLKTNLRNAMEIMIK